MSTNIQNMIGRYAYLMACTERNAAAGRKPPTEVVNEMNRLSSRAAAMLTPFEMQRATAAVNSMKAQHHHQFDVFSAQSDASDRQYYMDKVSKQLTGLTADQQVRAAKGLKYAVAATPGQLDKGAIAQMLSRVSREMGTAKPLTMNGLNEILARHEELQHMRGDEAARKYLGQTFTNPKRADAFIREYKSSGIDLQVSMKLREEANGKKTVKDTDHWVQPSESQQMRAQIAQSWAAAAKDDPGARHALIDDGISDDYRNSEHMHGDIARAFDKVESAEDQAERASYEAPRYNEQELEESNDAISIVS